ncbi:unnamed protein product [Durusdinium trenchii]|uniref:Uncharacterized protein n=1 Tax=Durusdinium trenchii TaxID=1381693 RepID=A0ABP0M1N1_9DINO
MWEGTRQVVACMVKGCRASCQGQLGAAVLRCGYPCTPTLSPMDSQMAASRARLSARTFFLGRYFPFNSPWRFVVSCFKLLVTNHKKQRVPEKPGQANKNTF